MLEWRKVIMATLFDLIEEAINETLDEMTKSVRAYTPRANNTKTVDSKKQSVTAKKKTKLSPPWWTVYNKIKAMFEADPDVTIQPMKETEDKAGFIIYLDTSDALKAVALSKILKLKYNFGNITLTVKVRVTNSQLKQSRSDTDYDNYLDALATTPAVIDIREVEDMFSNKWIVIDFKKEVVQFYNDDLTDFYGNWNGLYTDIATDIFKYNPSVKYTIAVTDE